MRAKPALTLALLVGAILSPLTGSAKTHEEANKENATCHYDCKNRYDLGRCEQFKKDPIRWSNCRDRITYGRTTCYSGCGDAPYPGEPGAWSP